MIDSKKVHGYIVHSDQPQHTDNLVRVSLKAVILNENGHVLVVKETGRDWWDIPGGGIDHGESIKDALARELREEVSLQGEFQYKTIHAEDPRYQSGSNLYQMRVTFVVRPKRLVFKAGEDGDEVQFIDPKTFENSKIITERMIFEYSQLAKSM